MRVLLVGDGNHQFIINLVKWLRETNNQIQIGIISFTEINNNNQIYYDQKVSPFDKKIFKHLISKIKWIRSLYRRVYYRYILNDLLDYENINFHYLSNDSFYITKLLKNLKYTGRIIYTIWGSDFYRISRYNKNEFNKSCNRADVITFTNEQTLHHFTKKLNWTKNNLIICRFGLAPLEDISELNKGKAELKNELNWNNSKLAITLGYNMSPQQQHLKIIKQISTLPLEIYKDKIQLIVPITYGGSSKYKNKICNHLIRSGYEYKVYDNYLEDQTIAMIRKASDIMIQLQTTDQFSGSMQEYLYTENIVITGSWLPYKTLVDKGVWFIELDEMNNLGIQLRNILDKYNEFYKMISKNQQVILNLSSWKINIYKWIDLYRS